MTYVKDSDFCKMVRAPARFLSLLDILKTASININQCIKKSSYCTWCGVIILDCMACTQLDGWSFSVVLLVATSEQNSASHGCFENTGVAQ